MGKWLAWHFWWASVNSVTNVIIETFKGDLRSSIWAEVAAFWGINTCLYYINTHWGISLLICNTGIPCFDS